MIHAKRINPEPIKVNFISPNFFTKGPISPPCTIIAITPTLRALISKKLDGDNQGSILSNLQGLQSLGGVLGIGMAGRVYDDFGPKAPFIAGSIILLFMIYLIAEGKNKKISYS